MNINILIMASAVAVLSSCSSAYKTSQTPDDIYYSAPTERIVNSRGGDEYLAVPRSGDRYSANRNAQSEYYDDIDVYRNDRWLRMSIGSPYRMGMFNNYYWNDWGYGAMGLGMGFSNWNYGYMNSWYNPWGSSMYWNSFYNPYSYYYNPYGWGHWGGGVITNPKPPVYVANPSARSSVFNPRAYNNAGSNNQNTRTSSRNYYNPRTGTYSNYNNTNNSSGNRSVNSNRSSNYNNNNTRNARSSNTYYDTRQNSNSGSSNRPAYTPSSSQGSGRPERSYTPSPSSSGGGRGSSGGGGEVRRPSR